MASKVIQWDKNVDKIIYLVKALGQFEKRKGQQIRVSKVRMKLRDKMSVSDVNKGIAILIRRDVLKMRLDSSLNSFVRFV